MLWPVALHRTLSVGPEGNNEWGKRGEEGPTRDDRILYWLQGIVIGRTLYEGRARLSGRGVLAGEKALSLTPSFYDFVKNSTGFIQMARRMLVSRRG